jgi:ribosomal protein L27
VFGGDTVSLTQGTGVFANKNVGTGKTVTASGFSLTGGDAANYSISQPTGLLANITQYGLSITGVTAQNKVYDSTTAATLAAGSLSGVFGGDTVSLTQGTGVFANKNVGTGKTVTASGFSLTGGDAANYSISQPTGLLANITARPLTLQVIRAKVNASTVLSIPKSAVTYNAYGLVDSFASLNLVNDPKIMPINTTQVHVLK